MCFVYQRQISAVPIQAAYEEYYRTKGAMMIKKQQDIGMRVSEVLEKYMGEDDAVAVVILLYIMAKGRNLPQLVEAILKDEELRQLLNTWMDYGDARQ